MDPKTKQLVDEAETRAAKATGGVWKLWAMTVMSDVDGSSDVATAVPVAATYQVVDGKLRTFDATFIAHARADIPALCLAVKEQNKRARRAEEERDLFSKRIDELEAQLHERTDAAAAWDALAVARLKTINEQATKIQDLTIEVNQLQSLIGDDIS